MHTLPLYAIIAADDAVDMSTPRLTTLTILQMPTMIIVTPAFTIAAAAPRRHVSFILFYLILDIFI